MPSTSGSITTMPAPASGAGALVNTACAALATPSSKPRIGGGGGGAGGAAAGGAGVAAAGAAAVAAVGGAGAAPACGGEAPWPASSGGVSGAQAAARTPSTVMASARRTALLAVLADIRSLLVIETLP